MPQLTNKKKLNEWCWLEIYFGNFNASLRDFLMGFSEKKSKQVLKIIFLTKNPRIFNLSLYFQKFHRKQAFTPENSTKLYNTSQKFQGQKMRPMEILHEFFSNTPGNSTSFLIDPWHFHMVFLQYPWKFHVLNPSLGFFLKQPNTRNLQTRLAQTLRSLITTKINEKYMFCIVFQVLKRYFCEQLDTSNQFLSCHLVPVFISADIIFYNFLKIHSLTLSEKKFKSQIFLV